MNDGALGILDNPQAMKESGRDFFLAEWLSHNGRRQADIVRELGWPKGRVSKIVNGAQPYQQADVTALADFFSMPAYKLFLRPADADALDQMRAAAVAIAAEGGRAFRDDSPKPGKKRPR